jgi:hypothetical protein
MQTMKHILIFMAILPFTVQAQRDKELQIRLGGGLGAYAAIADYSVQFGNDTYIYQDTSGAATKHFQIGVYYEVHHRIILGLDVRSGGYIYDPAQDNSGKDNKFNMVGLTADFNAVSREHFRWYVGLGLHSARLTITEPLFQGIEEYRGTSKWKGGGLLIRSGVVGYIAQGPIGLTFDFGFDTNQFNLNAYTIDGDSQNLAGWKADLSTAGLLLNAGVVWRFKP